MYHKPITLYKHIDQPLDLSKLKNLFLQCNISCCSAMKLQKYNTILRIEWPFKQSVWHFTYDDSFAYPFEKETIIKVGREMWVSGTEERPDGAKIISLVLQRN
jgi:hypothetical protein